MFDLHETYQLKVYDDMHNIVTTKTFNRYPTVEEIQAGIASNDNGLYAKVEKRYYIAKKEQHYD